MPTDLLSAMSRKAAAQKRETREQTFLVVLISLSGAAFTMARALQSDAFELAVLALGVVE